ncbi:MAG: hypothetical protein WBS33_06275 [Verrucomicrobiia bacterium]
MKRKGIVQKNGWRLLFGVLAGMADDASPMANLIFCETSGSLEQTSKMQ